MSTEYEYSTSTYFLSNINFGQFEYEVSNSSISDNMTGIRSSGSAIITTFDAALSTGDKTTLDTLATNHVPDPLFGAPNGTMQVSFDVSNQTDTVFVNLARITYPGDIYNTLLGIKTISNMDTGGTSYTLRLVNITDNNIVAEGIFTNTTETVCNFDLVQNIPTTEVILELHGKAAGSTTYNISNVTICYN